MHRGQLEREIEGIWGRLVSELPRGLPRAAFLLNQHAALVSALGERGVSSGEEFSSCMSSHAAALSVFVEASLDTHLRAWVGWVKKVEGNLQAALSAAGRANAETLTPQQLLGSLPEGMLPSVDAGEAEGVVKDLGLTWRSALSSLNDEVTRYASHGGGKSAMAVLKAVFSKLAEYHQRGEALLARAFATSPTPPWFRELVPLQNIYFEMRRFGRAE